MKTLLATVAIIAASTSIASANGPTMAELEAGLASSLYNNIVSVKADTGRVQFGAVLSASKVAGTYHGASYDKGLVYHSITTPVSGSYKIVTSVRVAGKYHSFNIGTDSLRIEGSANNIARFSNIINKVNDKAYTEGYSDGYNDGFEDGFNAGFKLGAAQ